MLGVVENMSDIRIPFNSLADPLAGISLVTKDGQDVTQIMMQRYKMRLLNNFIQKKYDPLFCIVVHKT